MPCFIKPDMHHTRLCMVPCCCGGCLLCCLLLFGLFPSLASVPFRSCEDPFDYVRLSSSWTRSSSLRDFRQDDHTLEITTIFACQLLGLLLCLCCDTYHLLIMPPILLSQASNPPCPSKPLIGYVTALLSPSYSVVSCRWSWRLLHDGQDYVGITHYLLFN